MASSTEVLRALLDERGMEHEDDEDVTRFFGPDGFEVVMQEDIDGKLDCLTPIYLTPEQAIEATLGPREQPPYDELIEALRRDWDIEASWDGLRRFWYVGLTDEGVRKRDEREATLGREECHNASNVTDKHGQARFVCSACNAWLDSRMLWNPEYPNGESPFVKDCRLNFCPNCGRKVVGA